MSPTRESVTERIGCFWRKILLPIISQLDRISLVGTLREYLAKEPMPFDPKDVREVAVAVALGGIAGAAIIQSHYDEKQKSQAEKDDPFGAHRPDESTAWTRAWPQARARKCSCRAGDAQDSDADDTSGRTGGVTIYGV